MNADIFQDRWTQVRSEAQRRWNKLTDQDLDDARESIDRLTGAVEERYHLSRKKAEKQVDRFIDRYGNDVQARTQSLLETARDFARQNPWAAFAAALVLIGLVSGLLSRRKTTND